MGEETPHSPDANNNEHEVDKENNQLPNRSVSSTSKCRRDLFPAPKSDPPTIELDMGSVSGSGSGSGVGVGDLAQHLVTAQQGQDQLYSYVYAASAAASLAQCSQPEICSALLRTLHAEQLLNLATFYRCSNGPSSTGTGTTTSTGSTSTVRRPLEPPNGNHNPLPYRTLSHFGFQSPRQIPSMSHKHLPDQRYGFAALGYRPMQRAISYEEIFASPRYEQLCQPCIDQLLRLKPELQRLRGSNSCCCEEELASMPSSSVTPKQRRLAPLPEIPGIPHQDASTQTPLRSTHFLSEIERFNFSDESTNVGFTPGLAAITSDFSLPGLEGSPGASATSAPPARVYPAKEPGTGMGTETNITEVWNFGNWQQPAEQNPADAAEGKVVEFRQQPLTERRITLEITQHFQPPGEEHEQEQEQEQEQGRQLMTRDERQRRKSEFQELWQDHVQYFGDKEKVQQEPPSKVEHTLKMSLDEQEVRALRANGWLGHEGEPATEENQAEHPMAEAVSAVSLPSHDDNAAQIDRATPDAADELPQMLKDFEESLSLAGENLQKLVATTKKLQSLQVEAAEEPETGTLFRSISLENIPNASDSVCLVERMVELDLDMSDSSNESINNLEEKHDDEKPVTPVLNDPEEATEKEKVQIERNDEKDVDENENETEHEGEGVIEMEGVTSSFQSAEATEAEHFHGAEIPVRYQPPQDSETFSPLELEILERIEVDKLSESEPIFGKIDHSIRNKLTPKKLQHLVREEIFRTCTRVYTRPSPISPSTTSSLSMHNISAPCSSTAHTHLLTRPCPRLSQSLSHPQQQQQQEERPEEQQEQSDERDTPSSTPLQRTISSTTFVCRRSTHRKRNFIQENIRNVAKSRSAIKPSSSSIQKSKSLAQPTSTASLSSVCTFEIGQRENGSRLWVSLPTPPRAAVNQKRHFATSPNTPRQSPRSPYSPRGKRRKAGVFLTPVRRCAMNPAVNLDLISSDTSLSYSLNRTLSSSTFCVSPEADNVSTTTFEVDCSQDQAQAHEQELEDPSVSTQNESSAATRAECQNGNASTSSMYYSASDNTQDQESVRSVENGGETSFTSDNATEEETTTNDIQANGDTDLEKSSSQVKEADTETSCNSSEGMPSIEVEVHVESCQTSQDPAEENSSSLDEYRQTSMKETPVEAADSNVSSSTSFKSVLEMSPQSGVGDSETTLITNQSECSDGEADETNDPDTKTTSDDGEKESSVVDGELQRIEIGSMEYYPTETGATTHEDEISGSVDEEIPSSGLESNSMLTEEELRELAGVGGYEDTLEMVVEEGDEEQEGGMTPQSSAVEVNSSGYSLGKIFESHMIHQSMKIQKHSSVCSADDSSIEAVIPDDEKPETSKGNKKRKTGGAVTVSSDDDEDDDDEKVVLSTSCTLHGMQIHVWDEKKEDMTNKDDEDNDK